LKAFLSGHCQQISMTANLRELKLPALILQARRRSEIDDAGA
jgi:hypothetical protein